MGFFFTKYIEGDDHGWLFFVRPDHIAPRRYQRVPMNDVTILTHEGSWFGAFYYITDGADQRRLRNTHVFFGTGKEVWARVRTQFREVAAHYYVKPLKVITDERVIKLQDCRYCHGKGEIEIPPAFEGFPTTEVDCRQCAGTCVEEYQ